jgi:hypothetical protein
MTQFLTERIKTYTRVMELDLGGCNHAAVCSLRSGAQEHKSFVG